MHDSNEQDLQDTRNERARQSALNAAEKLGISATGIVHYSSRGRLIAVGSEQAQWFAARVQAPLHAEVLLTDGEVDAGVPTTSLGGRALDIRGHLGSFSIELGERGKHNFQKLQADMIVDFSDTPLINRELPPPGYWHFGTELPDLDAALLAIDGMTGTFEKPRYFDYNPNICAHSRSGQPGCNQCIDSCPAEAIISIGEQVEVNPNLCQGGGICATVCPTGAMRYAYPPASDTAERVRLMLHSYLEAGGQNPVVIFVAEDDAVSMPPVPPNVLLVAVEELASVGHEIWLSAMAWGAGCVLLADGGSVPGKSRHALDQQLAISQALLTGLGYDADALRSVQPSDAPARCQAVDGLPSAASFSAGHPKRQLFGLAIEHLTEHAGDAPQRIALPVQAPYGEILINQERCTLCLSCTSVCPAGALSAGDEAPMLIFHESNCVQCGICHNACPENAIDLQAGFLNDPEQRRKARILYEEPPFCCVNCGKPFATRRVIDSILGKLEGHAMFQTDRARQRLQMCEDCRVVDAVQDTEAMQAGVFGTQTQANKNGKSQ